MIADNLICELMEKSNKTQAEIYQRFFKTGPGEYGEGDIFIGLKVPDVRKLAKKYVDIPLKEIKIILDSKLHEVRLSGAILLTYKYEKEDEKGKDQIYNFYIKNAKKLNNWDLVDVSCHRIVGDYLLNKPRDILYRLIKDKDKWLRRIAIVSTYTLIKNDELKDTFKLSEILIKDDFDLSHKATGWMLREAGKKDIKKLKQFLDKNILWMPRTTLRYAIERFPEKERQKYLKKPHK